MSKLSRNILYNLGGQGLLLALSFVATRVVYRRLGDEALGVIYAGYLLNSLVSGALIAGLSQTLVREIAQNAQKDSRIVSQIISTANILFWTAYGCGVLVAWLGTPWVVENWLNIHHLDPTTAATAIRLMLTGSLVGLVTPLYSGISYGYENSWLVNAIDVSTAALRQFGTLVIIELGGGLLLITAWIAFSFFLAVPLYWLGLAPTVRWRTLFTFAWSKPIIQRTYRFATGMMLVTLTGLAQTQIDKLVVSRLLPVGAFGYYSFTQNTAQRTNALRAAVGTALMPSFSGLAASGEMKRLSRQYTIALDILSIGSLPLYAAVAFAFPFLLQFMFGEEVANQLRPVSTLLILASFMSSTTGPAYNLALAMGHSRLVARANLVSVILSIPTSIVLIFRWGLNGAGMSWVVYYFTWYLLLVPPVYRRCLGLSARQWFSFLGRLYTLLGATYGAGWVVLHAWNPGSIRATGITYTVATACCLILGYFMLHPSSKLRLQEILSNRTRFRLGIR